MSEFESKTEIKTGSEKSFGLVFSIVFLLLALYPLINGEDVILWLLAPSAALAIISFTIPSLLKYPNKVWAKFGILLGYIIAPLVMFLVFVVVFLPIGLAMRLFGKDPLQRKIDANQTSYWIERTTQPGSMKNQF